MRLSELQGTIPNPVINVKIRSIYLPYDSVIPINPKVAILQDIIIIYLRPT